MDSIKDKAREQNEKIETKPRNLKYIIENKGKKKVCLLEPWLPEAGLVLIYAATGVGKTFFCLNSAYAVAGGYSFLKFTSPLPKKILYIDGEMSYDAMQPRIEAIANMYGPMINNDNFNLITCDQFPNTIMPKISTLEGQSFYSKIIFDNEIDLVFIDNISTMTDLDENSAGDWGIVQDWLIDLRSKRVSVVLVHHSGKDKKSQRGTSKREDILDSVILLEEINNGEKTMGTQFKITFKKKRNFFGEDGEPFEASLDLHGRWHMKTQEESNLDKVIELSKLGMSHREIANEVGINQSNVTRTHQKAVKLGLIKVDDKHQYVKKTLKGRHWEKEKD